jgi:chromosome segregation ATPase
VRKLFWIGLAAVGLVAFVGTDVVRAAWSRARTAVRDSLTADVPLRTQLAEAQAQVDAYAENVIRAEVAAENLDEMIGEVEREVRGLGGRVDREREALASLRQRLTVEPAAATLTPVDDRSEAQAIRRARAFKVANEALERRHADLERLRSERTATLQALAVAKAEQGRLADEVRLLAAEIESLDARTSAARTREAVGSATVSSSGFADARERLQKIRSTIKERNKLLRYYEFERDARPTLMDPAEGVVPDAPTALEAIDEALSAHAMR